MGKRNSNSTEHTSGKQSGPDAETRALNNSTEFQAVMAESERAIKEGRTRSAGEVFRRQRERRARIAVR